MIGETFISKIKGFTSVRRYGIHVPVKSFKSNFARKGPDLLTEELVAVLSGKTALEFKPLFDLVHANLCARKAANGSEEMLRLRIYEKLQHLVAGGMVKKTIKNEVKQYRGTASLAGAVPAKETV